MVGRADSSLVLLTSENTGRARYTCRQTGGNKRRGTANRVMDPLPVLVADPGLMELALGFGLDQTRSS